jgi:hypothetical protein
VACAGTGYTKRILNKAGRVGRVHGARRSAIGLGGITLIDEISWQFRADFFRDALAPTGLIAAGAEIACGL